MAQAAQFSECCVETTLKRLVHAWAPPSLESYIRQAYHRLNRYRGRAHQLRQLVRNTERQMWSGFSAAALARLEEIKQENPEQVGIVWSASFAQARWYAAAGQWQQAADLLAQPVPDRQSAETVARWWILKVETLRQMGALAEARAALEMAAQLPSIGQNLTLMGANVALAEARAGMGAGDAEEEWLGRVNRLYRDNGLCEVERRDASRALSLDNVRGTTALSAGRADGPLVSVLVPAFDAEDSLEYSVRSMLEQTHANVEVVVVDDRSPDGTAAVAQALADEDARVKLVRHEVNAGPYAARNTALALATGEYVTVHDSDDWSHPELLERQLAALEGRGVIATFSRLARVNPNLEFQLRPYRPMLEPIHWNYTCMLMRRDRLQELGGWDPVQAHADHELIQRVKELAGDSALVEVVPEVPLSLFRQDAHCVTERPGTSLRSVDVGARREYTAQAEYWRRICDGGVAWPTDSPRTGFNTPFFVPGGLRQSSWPRPSEYDVVLVSDLSLTGGTRRCNLAYVSACHRMGLRIGIANYPRFEGRMTGTVNPEYRALFQDDRIDLLTDADSVKARLLLVHHPPILRWRFEALPSIAADTALLLVNQLPFQTYSRDERIYEAAAVDQQFRAAFGMAPRWLPISGLVQRLLVEENAGIEIGSTLWTPILHEAFGLGQPRTPKPERKPVVGRHSRDHWTKWPATKDGVRNAYCAGADFSVRLLGGVSGALQLIGRSPRNWEVLEFDHQEAREFLNGIDVFVHYPHENYIEEFGRTVAEAMALGLPCILPPRFRETFGDAAHYVDENNVPQTVVRLWNDHEMYRQLSEAGLNFVKHRCLANQAVERINEELCALDSRDAHDGSLTDERTIPV